MSSTTTASTFNQPRNPRAYPPAELADIARFCRQPAGGHGADSDAGTRVDGRIDSSMEPTKHSQALGPDSPPSFAFPSNNAFSAAISDRGCMSPLQPSSFFSISVMEQEESLVFGQLYLPEFGPDPNQNTERSGLTRTASIREWMGALSQARLVETALEKISNERRFGEEAGALHERRWVEYRDGAASVAWRELFTSGQFFAAVVCDLLNSLPLLQLMAHPPTPPGSSSIFRTASLRTRSFLLARRRRPSRSMSHPCTLSSP